MKRILGIIFFAALAAGLGLSLCSAKKPQLLEFETLEHDFGTVGESADPVVVNYNFINTAAEPVAVLSVSTGCGCTRPDYPVRPIEPGGKGTIKITFLPKGQQGSVSKSIIVRYRGAKASSSQRITLRLRGTVK